VGFCNEQELNLLRSILLPKAFNCFDVREGFDDVVLVLQRDQVRAEGSD
jgi:hypothetical protein